MNSQVFFKYQIRKFILSILILLLFIAIADQITGKILRKYYFSQVAGSAYRTTFAMDSTTADLLIFGSSRASHHYVPEVFEKGLKMSYYNTGMDGSFLLYNYAVLKVILKRYTPKIIIFDLNPGEFYSNKVSYDRLSILLPYYSSKPEIRNIILLRSPYERIKLFSAIYPYNSLLTTIGIGNLKINKLRKSDQKGFIPLSGRLNVENMLKLQNNSSNFNSRTIGKMGINIDPIKIEALDSISKLCSKRNIRLYICYSPIYDKITKTQIDSVITKISKDNNSHYFNFSNDEHFLNKPDFFKDRSHLNYEGARKYSLLVLDSILKHTYVQ